MRAWDCCGATHNLAREKTPDITQHEIHGWSAERNPATINAPGTSERNPATINAPGCKFSFHKRLEQLPRVDISISEVGLEENVRLLDKTEYDIVCGSNSSPDVVSVKQTRKDNGYNKIVNRKGENEPEPVIVVGSNCSPGVASVSDEHPRNDNSYKIVKRKGEDTISQTTFIIEAAKPKSSIFSKTCSIM